MWSSSAGWLLDSKGAFLVLGIYQCGKMSGQSVDVVWEPPQLSSLDCWDYSIELACLQGPEGKI